LKKRLKLALPRDDDERLRMDIEDCDERLRMDIEDWYSVRSDPAHGRGIASGYDVDSLLVAARGLDKLISESVRQSNQS
jgi:hypothetical protein